MTVGAKIRSGALWMFMGKSGSQILNFAFGVVLARLLAPEVFGTLLTIQVFTGVASFIAGGGMGQALVRAKDTTRADYNILFTLQLIIGCIIYAVFFLTAPLIAAAYNTPIYADMIRVMALSFIFRPFANVPASILQREMRFKGMTVVGLASLIVSSSATIAFAYHGFGVWALIFGGLISPFVTIPSYSMLAKWRPGFSLKLHRAREIARYGMWVSVTDVLVYLRGRVSAFIMSFTLGPAAVGLYNKGESLAGMPNGFITASVYQVLLRALAVEQDDLDKCRYLFFRSIALVAVYATPFYVGLLWIAEPLVRGLYGEKWVAAAAPLFILVFAWPFWLVDMLSGAVLAAFAWLHRETVVQVFTLIVTCLLILVGLEYGIKGVAWALVISAGFAAVYMYHLATTCLRAHKTDLLHALIPAALLNTILAAGLSIVDATLPMKLHGHDLIYVLVMGLAGGIIYLLSFLFLPIGALQTERNRWKIKLISILKRG
jgi:O-antigen/teichoic acid export membrane protein